MGMDLRPMRPSKDAPRRAITSTYAPGEIIWGRYNWTGWAYITNKLAEWGVPLGEFDGSNDGKLITARTCRLVADAIELHLNELEAEDQKWLEPHIQLWRTCGGYRQY
jgi:hypothetical protein